jgi:polyisoprenoid-binding protein YceI
MTSIGALLLFALTAFTGPSVASSGDVVWIANAQSNVALSVSRLLSAKITGTLPIESATVVTNGDGAAAPLSVNATLDASRLDTRDSQRDAQLRGDQFFDVARFPTITFASERVTATGPDTFAIDGSLTMRGITHGLRLDGRFAGLRTDANGRQYVHYEATGSFRRTDYGMTYAPIVVGNNVQLDVDIEAVQDAATPSASKTPRRTT